MLSKFSVDVQIFRHNLQLAFSSSEVQPYYLCCSGDYISKQSYTADKPDELSFVENSILSVLKKNENGWWLAR